MELLPEADGVARQFVPCVASAAGFDASRLLAVGPVYDEASLVAAAREVGRLRRRAAGTVFGPSLFWAECAMWSALKGDRAEFLAHAGRMRESLCSSDGPPVH